MSLLIVCKRLPLSSPGRKGQVMSVCVGACALNQRLERLLRTCPQLSVATGVLPSPGIKKKVHRHVEIHRSGSSN